MSAQRIMFYHDGRHPLIYMYEPPMLKQEYEQAVDELIGTPVEAMVNYMIDFADNGLPFGGRSSPTVWFEHRLTLGESLLAVLGALKILAVCPNPLAMTAAVRL